MQKDETLMSTALSAKLAPGLYLRVITYAPEGKAPFFCEDVVDVTPAGEHFVLTIGLIIKTEFIPSCSYFPVAGFQGARR